MFTEFYRVSLSWPQFYWARRGIFILPGPNAINGRNDIEGVFKETLPGFFFIYYRVFPNWAATVSLAIHQVVLPRRYRIFSFFFLPDQLALFLVVQSERGPPWTRRTVTGSQPVFTGFYWLVLGFTGFYRVLPGFTGFYLVLLGFTGFYLVLLSFT